MYPITIPKRCHAVFNGARSLRQNMPTAETTINRIIVNKEGNNTVRPSERRLRKRAKLSSEG